MRSCGGSWMRRRCRICWAGRPRPRCSRPRPPTARSIYVQLAGGDVRVVATAGWEDEAGAGDGASIRQRQPVRPRHHRDRAARTRRGRTAIRPDRLAPADRAPGDAAAADDCGGRAAGIRAVRGARSPRRGRGPRRQSAVARAAAAGIPLRQRRDDARRRTDPASAGQRSDGADHGRERDRQGAGRRARFTSVRIGAPARSCRTTARPRAAIWPTASCSAIAAAASPARSPINRA